MAAIVTGVVLGVVLVVAVTCFLFLRRTGRANHLHDFREHWLPASTPGQGPLDKSTSLAPLPGSNTAVPIYQDLLKHEMEIYDHISHKGHMTS
ncbi:cell adhesion molecule CEACAM4-like [Castor canadensis]|uniref:Cell adhesion molecule CEACAM4-like n=1 Tax=Castor canadensis TaxID=51338 RepID=A0A8B7USI2_CASCN